MQYDNNEELSYEELLEDIKEKAIREDIEAKADLKRKYKE